MLDIKTLFTGLLLVFSVVAILLSTKAGLDVDVYKTSELEKNQTILWGGNMGLRELKGVSRMRRNGVVLMRDMRV